jgi:hypothetical protein
MSCHHRQHSRQSGIVGKRGKEMNEEEFIEGLKNGELRSYRYRYNASGGVFPRVYKNEKLFDEKGNNIASRDKLIYDSPQSRLSFIEYIPECTVYDGVAIIHNIVSAIKKEDGYNDDDEPNETLHPVEITNELLLNLEESPELALKKLLKKEERSKLIIADYSGCVYALFSEAAENQIEELLSAVKESAVKFVILKNETGGGFK